MKPQLAALMCAILFPALALAEVRMIAVEIHPAKHNAIKVSIHSQVKSESRNNISAAEAIQALKKIQGADSGVDVAVVTRGVPLCRYISILQAMADNLELNVILVTTGNIKAGQHILKQYNIEQAVPGDG